jgi:hypothetical protein
MEIHSTSNKEAKKENYRVKHKEELGMNIPENYFATSKMEILSMISKSNKPVKRLISRKSILWASAASIALVFAISVFKPTGITVNDTIPTIVSDSIDYLKNNELKNENLALNDDDFIISSLFIEEADVDTFVEDYVLDELVYQEIFLDK